MLHGSEKGQARGIAGRVGLAAMVVSVLGLDAVVARAEGSCFGRQPTITGTDGADHLEGTEGPDVIITGGGNDFLSGGDGDDRISGGPGIDGIYGRDGADLELVRHRGGRAHRRWRRPRR